MRAHTSIKKISFMKTLLLLRHAKPSSGSPTGRDFDRPLVEEGRAAAQMVGQFLRRERLTPAVVLCSPATRARETAERVIAAASFSALLLFDERIYEASVERLIELISEVSEDETDVLLLVGHNPGFEELLARLTGTHAPMRPATLARIDLDIDAWHELQRTAPTAGQLIFAVTS
jgi:phosphohistidine phosphatase